MSIETGSNKRSASSVSQQIQNLVDNVENEVSDYEASDDESEEDNPYPVPFKIPYLYDTNRAIPYLDAMCYPSSYCEICERFDEEIRQLLRVSPTDNPQYTLVRGLLLQHIRAHEGVLDVVYSNDSEDTTKYDHVEGVDEQATAQTKDIALDDFFDFDMYERDRGIATIQQNSEAPTEQSRERKGKPKHTRETKAQNLER